MLAKPYLLKQSNEFRLFLNASICLSSETITKEKKNLNSLEFTKNFYSLKYSEWHFYDFHTSHFNVITSSTKK